MDCSDRNSVFSDPGTSPANDARVTVIPDHNQPAINALVDASVNSVGADFISTMSGVAAYADSGATRAVMRHLGPEYGYPASSAPTLLRAGEFQSLRGIGTAGGVWGLEIGVHSEVPGDGWSKNIGIYLASSHQGWLNSGVKNDTAILITGEDGWHHALRYLNTDGAMLFNIDEGGSIWMNGYHNMPNLPFMSGYVSGICGAGQDAKILPISTHGFASDTNGAGGGTRVFIPISGTYEVSFGANALDNNTQVLLTMNGGLVQWGGASNAGCHIAATPFTVKCNAGEFFTMRCTNGRFGANGNFSNFSIRKVG